LLQFLLEGWLWLLTQVAGVWLAISLRGLAEHGRAVSTALACGDGARARLAVGQIVSRDRWSEQTLGAGDRIEIVHFVGGGEEEKCLMI
jgi:cobalamin biosynthesis protein CobD/CbiB